MASNIASFWWARLGTLVPREPTRCPYCPDRPDPHWIKWGTYWRSVHDLADWIRVPRHRCKFVRRTFSILPDGLLPYHRYRTAAILHHLRAMWLRGQATSTYASLVGIARSTLRGWRAAFARAARRLRLPDHEGALAPKPFLTRLLDLGIPAIVPLFAAWKEQEPKHSIVGLYAR